MGMNPVPWVVNSEIYPLSARSLGSAIATTTNWIGNLIVAMTFLDLTTALQPHGAFALYALLATIGWLFFCPPPPRLPRPCLPRVQTHDIC